MKKPKKLTNLLKVKNNPTRTKQKLLKKTFYVKKQKQVKRKLKIPLNITSVEIYPVPMYGLHLQNATERLLQMQELDDEVAKTEAAKNNLESYIYSSRETLSENEMVLEVSDEEMRDSVRSALSTQEEWLEEDGWEANRTVLTNKTHELEAVMDPILFRASELEKRPGMNDHIEEFTNYSRDSVAYLRANMTWVNSTFVDAIAIETDEFDLWYQNVTKLQAERDLKLQPVFLISDVHDKLGAIHQNIQRTLRIRKPIEKTKPNYDFEDLYGGFGRNSTGFGDNMANSSWFKDSMDRYANETGRNTTDLNETEYMSMYADMLKWRQGVNSTESENDEKTEENQSEDGENSEGESKKERRF